MSAFIVEDSCINTIAEFCERVAYSCTAPLCYLKQHVPPTIINDGEVEQFASELYRMNVAGVTARYGTADGFEPKPDYKFRPARLGANLNLFQIIKSIDCYLYQCSEGDIPETSALYKRLESLRDALALAMISQMPDYEAAKWG